MLILCYILQFEGGMVTKTDGKDVVYSLFTACYLEMYILRHIY